MNANTSAELWSHWEYLHREAMLGSGMGYDDAEDAAQEAMIGAWRSYDQWRGECPIEGWMRGILWRKVQDRRRRRGQELTKLEQAVACGTLTATLVEIDPDRRVVDGLPTPLKYDSDRPVEDEIDLKAASGAMWATMGRLPAHYRRVLVAKYLYGWTVDEMAQAMGLSYKAAESLLTRARVALRKGVTNERGT